MVPHPSCPSPNSWKISLFYVKKYVLLHELPIVHLSRLFFHRALLPSHRLWPAPGCGLLLAEACACRLPPPMVMTQALADYCICFFIFFAIYNYT